MASDMYHYDEVKRDVLYPETNDFHSKFLGDAAIADLSMNWMYGVLRTSQEKGGASAPVVKIKKTRKDWGKY